MFAQADSVGKAADSAYITPVDDRDGPGDGRRWWVGAGHEIVFWGKARDEDGGAQWLASWQKMDYSSSYTAFAPDGTEGYTYPADGIGFSGSLDKYLEGDGTLNGGPATMNWATSPVGL